MKFMFRSFSVVLSVLVVGPSALAQEFDSFRHYEGNLVIISEGPPKKVSVSLDVDEEVIEERFGDPEIPGHGFVRKVLQIRISIDGKSSVVRTMDLQNSELLVDRGIILKFDKGSDLLNEKLAQATVLAEGSRDAIGVSQVSYVYRQDGGDHLHHD